jgi:hypothetical protein
MAKKGSKKGAPELTLNCSLTMAWYFKDEKWWS